MAGSKSNYLENELLDHVLGGADWPRPATVYMALFTVAPTDAGGGTEVTGGSYVRKDITNNSTNFPAAAGGAKSNGVAITFAKATANWGTVLAWALFDVVTSGNMLYWGDVSPSKLIEINDTAEFAVGDLDITED
jgi:hypothetical protein